MIKYSVQLSLLSLPSDAVKNLVIDLLAAYAKRTDNAVDDYAVDLIRRELFDEKSE